MGEANREAFLYGKGKDPAVLAGSPFFTEIFAQLGCGYVTFPNEAESILESFSSSAASNGI